MFLARVNVKNRSFNHLKVKKVKTEKLKYRKDREEALKFLLNTRPFWLFKKRWDFRSTINMTDNLMEERA